MGTITVLLTSIERQRALTPDRSPHPDIGAEHDVLREMAATLRWDRSSGGYEGPSFGWSDALGYVRAVDADPRLTDLPSAAS